MEILMIVPSLARLLIREHHYKPIRGKILILGRQTIAMSPENLTELLLQEKLSISAEQLNEIKTNFDQNTRHRKDNVCVSDEVFFNLFGICKVDIMDVSEYEGANIIHDLNNPIPRSLENQYDFIIDGGTFDHLVDLRVAFENVVKMLKVGGRVFQWNAASNFTGAAYISFGPDLFYDYYILNQFADCKIYIAELDSIGQLEQWDLYEFEGADEYDHLKTNRIQVTVALSEKGSSSTWDKIPIQAQYRDADLWQLYRNGQNLTLASERKYLTSLHVGQTLKSRSVNLPESLIKRLFSKLKEKGFIWVSKKIVDLIVGILLGKNPRKIKGYKYIGRV